MKTSKVKKTTTTQIQTSKIFIIFSSSIRKDSVFRIPFHQDVLLIFSVKDVNEMFHPLTNLLLSPPSLLLLPPPPSFNKLYVCLCVYISVIFNVFNYLQNRIIKLQILILTTNKLPKDFFGKQDKAFVWRNLAFS